MKKKITLLAILGAVVFSLSACSLFSNDNGGGYSYRPIGSSGGNASDVSTPPAGDLDPIEAGRTYRDYINNNIYSISATPSVGKAKLLVIPVWFNDSNNFIHADKKDNVKADIQTAYFGKNTDIGWRSVKTYYEEESHGKLKIDGTVSNWYEPNKSYQYYSNDDANHSITTSLVRSAIKWYFEVDNPSDSRVSYDCDKDGYLDGVMLIYAAPDSDVFSGGANSNLWAYCFWVQEPSEKNTVKPGVNAFFWASYDFMYGKSKASSRAGTNYANGDTNNNVSVDAHTYVHEMGHMFGLEDYYDYSDFKYLPAGGFSMQDNNVGGHDPFSVFSLGWGKAYVPTTSMNIDLKPFTSSGEMIILSPNWNSFNSPFDEYLILEYYTSDGLNYFDSTYPYMQGVKTYPTGSKESGIRLWHVDARLLYTMNGSYSAAKTTTDPKISGNKVTMMMSNTYNDGHVSADYLSPLMPPNNVGENEQPYYYYSNCNILELVRNSTLMYTPTTTNKTFTSANLFKAGDTFNMSRYTRQFVNNAKLNNGSSLGFAFTVNALNSGYASITVNKI